MGGLGLVEAFLANAMGSRGIKALLEEFFERHPTALVLDAAAPGANLHEFLKILQLGENTTGGTGDEEPDAENEKHLQNGLSKIGDKGLVTEN